MDHSQSQANYRCHCHRTNFWRFLDLLLYHFELFSCHASHPIFLSSRLLLLFLNFFDFKKVMWQLNNSKWYSSRRLSRSSYGIICFRNLHRNVYSHHRIIEEGNGQLVSLILGFILQCLYLYTKFKVQRPGRQPLCKQL